jgi:hypothetical protein
MKLYITVFNLKMKPSTAVEKLANFNFAEDVKQINSNFSEKPLKEKELRRPTLVGKNKFH